MDTKASPAKPTSPKTSSLTKKRGSGGVRFNQSVVEPTAVIEQELDGAGVVQASEHDIMGSTSGSDLTSHVSGPGITQGSSRSTSKSKMHRKGTPLPSGVKHASEEHRQQLKKWGEEPPSAEQDEDELRNDEVYGNGEGDAQQDMDMGIADEIVTEELELPQKAMHD